MSTARIQRAKVQKFFDICKKFCIIKAKRRQKCHRNAILPTILCESVKVWNYNFFHLVSGRVRQQDRKYQTTPLIGKGDLCLRSPQKLKLFGDPITESSSKLIQ